MGALGSAGKAFGAAEGLAELINERFNQALEQKTLVYIPSEAEYYQGRAFHIRIVPAFVKKPNAIQDQVPKSQIGIMGKRTALLNVSPDHVIAQAGSFRIILNKYCAVKNQILLTSILPRSQSETLDACELASVYRTLKALPRNHLAFYNCGKDGGASQPHKHVQIAPLELDVFQDLFPNKVISRSVSQDASKQSALIQHPDVPYAHFIVRTAGECTGEYLQSLFNTLLSATKSALGSQLDDAQPTPAYNFLMTSDWMMMIPRTNAACNGVGVNAVGMLGILWLESDGQLQALNNIGFDDALVYVGLRKAEVEV